MKEVVWILLPIITFSLLAFILELPPRLEGYVEVIEVKVEGNRVELLTKEGELELWVSEDQAFSILHAKEKYERPLCHDLVQQMLKSLDSEVYLVTIDKREEGIYYATVYLKTPFGMRRFDSRPSDAIALALRFDASIMVKGELLPRSFPQFSPIHQA